MYYPKRRWEVWCPRLCPRKNPTVHGHDGGTGGVTVKSKGTLTEVPSPSSHFPSIPFFSPFKNLSPQRESKTIKKKGSQDTEPRKNPVSVNYFLLSYFGPWVVVSSKRSSRLTRGVTQTTVNESLRGQSTKTLDGSWKSTFVTLSIWHHLNKIKPTTVFKLGKNDTPQYFVGFIVYYFRTWPYLHPYLASSLRCLGEVLILCTDTSEVFQMIMVRTNFFSWMSLRVEMFAKQLCLPVIFMRRDDDSFNIRTGDMSK